MALLTQGDVVRRVQALLDDPAGRRFKPNYLSPYVDQENEDLLVMLETLGAQMLEQQAVINLPAATNTLPTDLTAYMGPGQPLQYMMRPKLIKWKQTGQPDTNYIESDFVNELDEVQQGNLGCQQWAWTGGAIQLTPSFLNTTIKIYFDAVAQAIYDPTAQVMRGIGNILALATAVLVCSMNNDMGKLGARLEKKLSSTKLRFSNLITMQGQIENKFPRSTKRGAAVQVSAGGTPYI